MSEALDKAIQIIGTDPMPKDAERQLEALQAQADKSEQRYFADIWSAYENLSEPKPLPIPE